MRGLCESHTLVFIEGKAHWALHSSIHAKALSGLGSNPSTGMESLWPSDAQGTGTSSGSGADFHNDGFSWTTGFSWTNNAETTDALDTEMAFMTEASYSSSGDLKPGERFNHKTAPSFNGMERWYIFEELVWDWCDITIIEPEKRGPHLRNRLTGDAIVKKLQMDKEKFKQEDGVRYFWTF